MKLALRLSALAVVVGMGVLWAQSPTPDSNSPQPGSDAPPTPEPPPAEEIPVPNTPPPMPAPPNPMGAPKSAAELRKTVVKEKSSGKSSGSALAKSAGKSSSKTSLSADSSNWLNVDYVDEPILDVLRSIATAYRLSIIPDKDIGEVKVTIHLEKIPVLEGLDKLCRSHGLELIHEGDVYHVRKQVDAQQNVMQVMGGKLYLEIKNVPVRDFLREFSDKTGINIVPGQSLKGKMTGQLRIVQPVDGLKALAAANNFTLRQRSGVYLMENGDSADNSGAGFASRRRFMPPGGGNGSSGEVDVHNGLVTLNCRNSALSDVLREIAEQAGLNYSVISDLSGTVNAELRDVPVDEALMIIFKGTRFSFARNKGTLLVGDRNPNTPSGQALSTADLIYLKYIRAENVEKLLPKTLADNVRVIKEQNAILVSGTAEDNDQAREFLAKVDLPTPQVLLEVVVVEYNRGSGSDLGIAAGKDANAGGPNLNITSSFSGIKDQFTQGSFHGAIGILPPTFDLSLRALESQDKAKVLSMPKLTTLNGNKAELRVTGTSYYTVSSVTKDGFQNNDYRAIDDGITIDITPWITKEGSVNINVNPTIKTSSPGIGGQPGPVTNRSISTNVELMDGESIALGGLISSKETNQRNFVPILGSIPILKYLFSYRSLKKTTNELVIYVTPHILSPDRQSLDLQAEFKSMEKRDGEVKPEDIFHPRTLAKPSKPVSPPKDSVKTPAKP